MAYVAANSNTIEAHTLGLPPIISLSSVSTTGAGTALDGLAIRTNAVMVVTTSAGVSAGSVQMQASNDNSNWYSIGSAVSTTAASTTTQVTVTSAFSRWVRANVATTITGTGTPTVTVSVGVSG